MKKVKTFAIIVVVAFVFSTLFTFAAFGVDKFVENGWTFAYHRCLELP